MNMNNMNMHDNRACLLDAMTTVYVFCWMPYAGEAATIFQNMRKVLSL